MAILSLTLWIIFLCVEDNPFTLKGFETAVITSAAEVLIRLIKILFLAKGEKKQVVYAAALFLDSQISYNSWSEEMWKVTSDRQ